jgi:hypothetical protein
MNVKNVFLHGDLKEKVYMNPFSMPISSPIDVCKLNYFLYGLKQTPKTWFKIFSALSLGFHLFIIIMTLLFFYR